MTFEIGDSVYWRFDGWGAPPREVTEVGEVTEAGFRWIKVDDRFTVRSTELEKASHNEHIYGR